MRDIMGLKYHALIRFGKWQEIIDLEAPTDPDLYLVTTTNLPVRQSLGICRTGRRTFQQ